MASMLKARFQAYDPCFSQALRYLISIHNGFCYRRGVTSPISHITSKLLSAERDPPATRKECLYEAPQFNEVDVQALVHAVELLRQGAIDSLRYADGDLFTAFKVALGASLGIEEPLLMKIMRATLHTHTEWFKLQMCTDRFEKLLRINELKEIDCGMLMVSKSEPNPDSFFGATSHVTGNSTNTRPADGSGQPHESSREILFDETAILQIMEFLALPRSDAIQLLAQYDGSADAVFQQIFT